MKTPLYALYMEIKNIRILTFLTVYSDFLSCIFECLNRSAVHIQSAANYAYTTLSLHVRFEILCFLE